MCCLFGMADYGRRLSEQQKSRIIRILSQECEVRGTDATGIAYNSHGRLRVYKRPMAAHKLHFRIPPDASVVMGHTRMATQGDEKFNCNNHPFYGKANVKFALAHNGVLYNDVELRKKLDLPQTKIQTDSYIAAQLIEQQGTLDLDSLCHMAEQVEGSFCFTVLDEKNNLYFVKGDNPLCIYRYPKTGLLLYASTEEILRKALQRLRLPLEAPIKVDLDCGDVLMIDATGRAQSATFDTSKLYRSYFWRYASTYTGYTGLSLAENKNPQNAREAYIRELKSVAPAFGYSEKDVDTLLEQGVTPEELEDYFYCIGDDRYEYL